MKRNNRNQVQRISRMIIITTFALAVLISIGYAGLALFVLNNPEQIGEWLGRLVGGIK